MPHPLLVSLVSLLSAYSTWCFSLRGEEKRSKHLTEKQKMNFFPLFHQRHLYREMDVHRQLNVELFMMHKLSRLWESESVSLWSFFTFSSTFHLTSGCLWLSSYVFWESHTQLIDFPRMRVLLQKNSLSLCPFALLIEGKSGPMNGSGSSSRRGEIGNEESFLSSCLNSIL